MSAQAFQKYEEGMERVSIMQREIEFLKIEGGSAQEIDRIAKIQREIIEECDHFYCQLFMLKAG